MSTKDRYAKLSGRFWRHQKVMGLSEGAVAMWSLALSYTVDQMTDGVISAAVARRLGRVECADELVAAGLWHVTGDGWSFHDYAEHNITAEKWEAHKSRKAKNKQDSRARVTGDAHDVSPSESPANDHDVTAHVTGDSTGDSQTHDARRMTISEIDPRATAAALDKPLGRVLAGFRERWDRRYGAMWRPTSANLAPARARAAEYADRPERLAETLDGFFATADAFVVQNRHPFKLWANDPERWVSKPANAITAEAYDPRKDGDLGHLGGLYRAKHNLLIDVGERGYDAAVAKLRRVS